MAACFTTCAGLQGVTSAENPFVQTTDAGLRQQPPFWLGYVLQNCILRMMLPVRRVAQTLPASKHISARKGSVQAVPLLAIRLNAYHKL